MGPMAADGDEQRQRRIEIVDWPFTKVGEEGREILCEMEIEGMRSRDGRRKGRESLKNLEREGG